MTVKLSGKWVKRLLALPETGMGYQKVDLVLRNGRSINNVNVLNAEKLILPFQCKLKETQIADIRLHKS